MTKTLKYLMLMLVATFSLQFTACSDDDEPNDTSLADTSWRIISLTYNSNGSEKVKNYGDLAGNTITFHKDGSVSFSDTDWNESTECDWWDFPASSTKWYMSNGKLIMEGYYDNGELDDYVAGAFVINGEYATYTYNWYNYDGTSYEDTHVLKLQKVK